MEMFIQNIIGPDSDAITWWQMCIRGVLGFIFALIIIRAGDKRIFGKSTSLDIVLGIVLGSNISRAITANAPFFPVFITSGLLVFLHYLLAKLSCHSKFSYIVKGREYQLVKNGQMLQDAMEKHQITENDLREALRTKGNTLQIEDVEAAFLERSGSISVITKK